MKIDNKLSAFPILKKRHDVTTYPDHFNRIQFKFGQRTILHATMDNYVVCVHEDRITIYNVEWVLLKFASLAVSPSKN